MFHKLKQKASLARVNILGDGNSDKDYAPRQKPRILQPIAENPSPIYASSDLNLSVNAAASHISQVEDLRNELNRMVRLKQDALNRVRRADARRVEATNRGDLLAQQFERSSHEVGRLQIELDRKDEAHRLEKQAILQDSLSQIIRNDTAHIAERTRLEQQLRNTQSSRDAELRQEKDFFTYQLMEVQRRNNEEMENLRSRNQAQDQEIRILRQNLRSELQAKSKLLDRTTIDHGSPVRAAAGTSGGWISGTVERSKDNLRREVEEKNASLERAFHEVETLRRSKREMESLLASLRQENEERHRARDVLQTELEEKTRVLEERSLVLNRTRNELNEEKRKARQALADNADKNRQLEFVQQQCARLQESLSQQSS